MGPQGPQGPAGPAGAMVPGTVVKMVQGAQPPAGWILIGSTTENLFLNNRLVKLVTNYYRVP